ncbi:MAG TPA: alpha/beta hydrolase [Polyangiaceae bacterium]|jgi:pimeloyl-ACP methyl ester carboxylesterase|nr:alpha/beta hydrolase [Polyangiaceae bacterium]
MTAPRSVVSADGTTIAYRQRGDGPGLVLIHGGLQAARNFTQLAEALSSSFRVCVPDRRGRGGSGPFGPEYGLAREAEDLDALLRQTGARFVFGLSSGALIALHAARSLSGIDRVAAYEPPFTIDGVDPAAWVSRYESEIDRGDLAAAMVSALKGTADVGPLMHLPRVVMIPLVRLALRAEARKSRGQIAIRDLIPTLRFDARLQREASGFVDALPEIPSEVLLVGGDRSHPALRTALDAVARRMPRARRVRLSGVGHIAADDHGRPGDVANELRTFFARPRTPPT